MPSGPHLHPCRTTLHAADANGTAGDEKQPVCGALQAVACSPQRKGPCVLRRPTLPTCSIAGPATRRTVPRVRGRPVTTAIFVREHRGQRGFDLGPGHARGPHRQPVAHVDQRVEPGAKEVVSGHRMRSQKLPRNDIDWNQFRELWSSAITPQGPCSCGLSGFCRADSLPTRSRFTGPQQLVAKVFPSNAINACNGSVGSLQIQHLSSKPESKGTGKKRHRAQIGPVPSVFKESSELNHLYSDIHIQANLWSWHWRYTLD